MIAAFALVLVGLTSLSAQDVKFAAPAEAGLRGLPFTYLTCGNEWRPSYFAMFEYSETRNFMSVTPQGSAPQIMDNNKARIGTARIKQLEGGAEFTLRPVDATNIEVTFVVSRSSSRITGSLSLDGGRTHIECRDIPRAPKV